MAKWEVKRAAREPNLARHRHEQPQYRDVLNFSFVRCLGAVLFGDSVDVDEHGDEISGDTFCLCSTRPPNGLFRLYFHA